MKISIIEPQPIKSTKIRVVAYCRVSTDEDAQENSLENQIVHYTDMILENPDYEMAGVYHDEGISGTNTKKREQFNIKDILCYK